MGERELHLLELSEDMREEFLNYCREFASAGETNHADRLRQARENWPLYVRTCRKGARGLDLPEGAVPQTFFCLFAGRRMLGTCRLRHKLDDQLRVAGGHIGYDVRPSERGKGFATRMLALALEKAHELGLPRVLLTCDKANVASARVIVKNGGVLEDEVISPRDGELAQRYWIQL